MAEKKHNFLVMLARQKAVQAGWDIEVWCNNTQLVIEPIGKVEGILSMLPSGTSALLLHVDARYSISDVMAEAEGIVQDVFGKE